MPIKYLLVIGFLFLSAVQPNFVYAQTASISATPSASPTLTSSNKLEKNVSSITNGTIPLEAIKQQPDEEKNILDKILSVLRSFINPLTFLANSETIDQATIPSQLLSDQTDPSQKATDFAAGNGDYFGKSVPKEVISENSYQTFLKANFPPEALESR